MSEPDGGPAFACITPEKRKHGDGKYYTIDVAYPGMALRTYAAIKLRVLDSGVDWLDEMIVKSQRNEFAGQALVGLLSGWEGVVVPSGRETGNPADVASFAYQQADAMLREGEGELT